MTEITVSDIYLKFAKRTMKWARVSLTSAQVRFNGLTDFSERKRIVPITCNEASYVSHLSMFVKLLPLEGVGDTFLNREQRQAFNDDDGAMHRGAWHKPEPKIVLCLKQVRSPHIDMENSGDIVVSFRLSFLMIYLSPARYPGSEEITIKETTREVTAD